MGFNYNRKYKCYLILGNPTSSKLPWSWEEWKKISGLLNPIVERCRAKPLLKSGQQEIGTNKWVSLGKLVWNEASFQKWTHKSPLTNDLSDKWGFYYVELAAPSLQICQKESLPPDLFFALTNESFQHKKIAFNPRFFIALAEDLDSSVQKQLENVVKEIAHSYDAILKAVINRPWGKPTFGGSAFQDAIQDMGVMGVFKVGNPHARPVTLDTLKEEWKELR